MPTECTSARELCQNNDGSYGEDCLQRFEENCRGNIPEHCEVRCLRLRRRSRSPSPGAVERCQAQCSAHMTKFKFDSNGRKASQAKLGNRTAVQSIARPLFNVKSNYQIGSKSQCQSQPRGQCQSCQLSWRPNTGHPYHAVQLNSTLDCPKDCSTLRAPYKYRN